MSAYANEVASPPRGLPQHDHNHRRPASRRSRNCAYVQENKIKRKLMRSTRLETKPTTVTQYSKQTLRPQVTVPKAFTARFGILTTKEASFSGRDLDNHPPTHLRPGTRQNKKDRRIRGFPASGIWLRETHFSNSVAILCRDYACTHESQVCLSNRNLTSGGNRNVAVAPPSACKLPIRSYTSA
jgi:hypothetical protein